MGFCQKRNFPLVPSKNKQNTVEISRELCYIDDGKTGNSIEFI
jgi:hypothetical protein